VEATLFVHFLEDIHNRKLTTLHCTFSEIFAENLWTTASGTEVSG